MPHVAAPFSLWRPGPPLSEFVDFLWAYEAYEAPHSRERLLPTGTMELVFAMDDIGDTASSVVGARTECLMLDTSRPFSVLGVHFKPGGGLPFFGVPGCELQNRRVTLDLLWGRHALVLTDRLWETLTPRERFPILERALLDKARGRLDRHPAVRYALCAFDQSAGVGRVGDVVRRIGLSSRRFTEVFQSQVGLSPKAFCRIRRFNEVLSRLERATDVNWADVALSCGYFDQAHFNHDFRAFSGLCPSTYLSDRVSRTHIALTDT